jgi:mono/diheme cytochrome c family protein
MKRRVLTVGAALLCAGLTSARDGDPGSRNPYEGNAEAARAGRKLFGRHCAECHGADARGAREVPGLMTSRVRRAPAGGLFWFLTNGNRGAGMPSWSRLPAARRWQIVTFLKSPDAAATVDSP